MCCMNARASLGDASRITNNSPVLSVHSMFMDWLLFELYGTLSTAYSNGPMDSTIATPITIYARPLCGYCWAAKRILSKLDLAFIEVNCNDDPDTCNQIQRKTGHRTVPMIFVGEHFVGGCDELRRLVQRDELMPLIDRTQERTNA